MSPLFSIIIPYYNSYFFIKDTLSILLSQALDNEKVIDFNDGFFDNMLERAQSFLENDIPQIIVFPQKNKGLSVTQNTSFGAIKGKYVYFLGSDDSLFPVFLSFFWQFLFEYERCNLFLFSYKSRKNYKRDKLYLSLTFDGIETDSCLLIKRFYAVLYKHNLFSLVIFGLCLVFSLWDGHVFKNLFSLSIVNI